MSGPAYPPALFLIAAVLASCGAQPAPQFFGAERFSVARDGRSYVIFKKGRQAEIIRLGWARHGQHQAIRATMLDLVPEVTGCKLRETTWQGDSGEMRGALICPRSGQ